MRSVTSPDGTSIAYDRFGAGPPLVLVHGSICDHTYWHAVRDPLARRFDVIAVERRGRGHSGDTQPYALEREFEDVAAVVEALGEPVVLLGHSYGALCALGATMLDVSVATLVLYEPPLGLDGFESPPGLVGQLEELVAAGDRDGVIATMLSEVVGLTDAELAELRASESWPALVETADSMPRELRAAEQYRFQPERFRVLIVPTVVLAGDQSPRPLLDGVRLAHEAIRGSRVVTMAGVGHEAVETSPETFVAAVLAQL
jgi:pimeloyl-ACP methyl ester carboxylesterase